MDFSKKKKCVFYVTLFILIKFSFGQLSALNDEFNNASLDPSWTLFQDQFFTTPVPFNSGKMQINLTTSNCSPTCVWWQTNSAGLIYKTVTGNFDVETAVYTKQKTNISLDIANDTQLAGLIARDPASTSSGLENYVFNVAGVRFDNPSIELKSTTNDGSSIRAYTDNMTTGTNAEVRIVRTGSLFELYSRPIGSTTWIFRDSFTRTDLPNTLQVGLIAYAFESYPENLIAEFDYIRFSEVGALDIKSIDFDTIKIYQPHSNLIQIKGIQQQTISLTLFNLLGEKIKKTTFNSGEKIEFEVPNLNSGIYILQLKTLQGSINKKIYIP